MKKRFCTFLGVLFWAFINSLSVYSQEEKWVVQMKYRLERIADSLTVNLKPWNVPERIFNVEDYGACGDGTTMNTVAIQKAIDACSVAGGGVVLFSKGNYVTGTIRIKSGVMIEVAEGSKILGSTDIKDYPDMIESFKSVMSENYGFRQSLIYAEKADHVGIRGRGEIYFRGEKANFSSPETTGPIKDRPLGIRMIECTRVVLQDILLHNSASWMQNYLACKDLIFDGIRVENQANYNNDGLDPDGCTNVIVRNCVINAEDDAMCIKGASSLPSRNILIENSTFVSTCNAFKIGTDTQGDFSDILVRNCVLGGVPETMLSIEGHEASTGITIATVDGGNVSDIMLTDITIERARCPVFLRIGNRGRVVPGTAKPLPGKLQRILIEKVKGEHNFRQGSFISGIPGYPIEDVCIHNYKLKMQGGGTSGMVYQEVCENETGYPDAHKFLRDGLPSYGFYVRHARNISFDGVSVVPTEKDMRPEVFNGGDVFGVSYNGTIIGQ